MMHFHSTQAKSFCRNGKATSKLLENSLFQLWDEIHVGKNKSKVIFSFNGKFLK